MATDDSTSRAAKDGHHNVGRLRTLSDGTKAFIPNSDTSSVIGNSQITDGAEIYSVVHKFGKNDAVIGSLTPICLGGLYLMPLVTNATTLRIKAGDANDTAAGSGAREITIEGIDETGALCVDVLPTAGASASINTVNAFLRTLRAYVSESGTYPEAIGTHSQAANITIENSAGTADWLIINATMAQSHVGAYTVPLGKVAYLNSFFTTSDGNKEYDLLLYGRKRILQTAAPFYGFRNLIHSVGLTASLVSNFKVPKGPFPALMDLVFAAIGPAGGATITVDFEILLKDT